MRIAYLDCASGISGDMMLGALIDAGVSIDAIQAGIDSLRLPSCRLEVETVKRAGFRASKVHVRHEPEHAHRHLHHITDMIDASTLTDRQRELATRIFTRLGEAEATVHGTTIRKVHFHEVGAVDSIADIVGSAIGWALLGVDDIVCSPVPTGHGSIMIAHGRTSVPAPATAELLKGVPIAASDVEAELTTPTGAAIITSLASRFGSLPAMTIEAIGCGAGDRNFDTHPNILRLLVGTCNRLPEAAAESATASRPSGTVADHVMLLETNLDNVTAEIVGHTTDVLMTSGALDVFSTAIQMKKQRPGVALSVLCRPADAAAMESIIFRELPTLGIRRTLVERDILARRPAVVETRLGPVAGHQVTGPDGRERFAPEYEACKLLAEKHQLPLRDVLRLIRDDE